MTVVVFAGPTLPAEEGRAVLDAEFLPPAGQGDVYLAARDGARAIGIIDGYFERIPAVWHKEILWALSEGVHVFGSASMGALRAAELAPFGMEGVGAIYEAFRDGALEDDDEVAVAHGAADTAYRVLSEAMVNIRATLRAAEEAGVLGAPTREAVERIAKALFYPERTYPQILARARDAGLPRDELAALAAFLPRGAVNEKRRDALAMLRRMRERLDGGLERRRVDHRFEHTDAWEQLVEQALRRRPGARDALGADALLEELGVAGARPAAELGASRRVLALAQARRQGVAVTDEMLEAAVGAIRRRHDLPDLDAARRWMRDQGLGDPEFHQLIREEAQLAWIEAVFAPDFARAIPAYLRSTGEYAAWARRARDKQRVLEASGLAQPERADTGLREEELWRWYFEVRIAAPIPDDLWGHARAAGFASRDDLRRAVLREYHYARLAPPEGSPGTPPGSR